MLTFTQRSQYLTVEAVMQTGTLVLQGTGKCVDHDAYRRLGLAPTSEDGLTYPVLSQSRCPFCGDGMTVRNVREERTADNDLVVRGELVCDSGELSHFYTEILVDGGLAALNPEIDSLAKELGL